ncbi:outer membrane beta-barrel protein [bacterium]|nr:outer membrane beta-barrel protein [bacterium]
MRHTRTILLSILALALIASCAYAQRTPGTYSIGAFGGVAMPQGPEEFKDYFKSGLGFGGEFKYNVNPKMSLAGSFSMVNFGYNVDQLEKEFDLEGAKLTVDGGGVKVNVIQANVLYYLMPAGSATELYAIGGGGYYMMTPKNPDKVEIEFEGEKLDITEMFEMGEEESENDFGVQFGVGMDLPLGSMNLFFEGKYHIVFTEDESTKLLSVMAGLRFPM